MKELYKNKSTIAILMATYNCDAYVAQQIDSIFDQTYTDWELIIRDDNSTSRSTVNIITKYQTRHPDKIHLIQGTTNLGACQNFSYLLQNCESDYYMFSDCDDVWLSAKVEKSFAKLLEMEREHGTASPLLVHTDSTVVTSSMNILGESLWRFQNIQPDREHSLRKFIIRNTITGCTVILNKALRDIIGPIPGDAIMHDWWIALVAAAFGKIDYVDEPTMLYRQHDTNSIGAKKWSVRQILDTSIRSDYIKKRLHKKQLQIKAFLERYGYRLSAHDGKLLRTFADCNSLGFLERRYEFIKYGLFEDNLIRNIGMYLYL